MKLIELLEGRGSQALDFVDYVSKEIHRENIQADFLALGKALFKDGWTFHSGQNSPRFTLPDPDQDDGMTGWTITFPNGGDIHGTTGLVTAQWIGVGLFIIGLYFVYRSFYGMRITTTKIK